MNGTLKEKDMFKELVSNFRENFRDFLSRADRQYYDAIKIIIYLSCALFAAVLFMIKFGGIKGLSSYISLVSFVVSVLSGILALLYSAHNSFKKALYYERKIKDIDLERKYEDPQKIMQLWEGEAQSSIARNIFIRDNLLLGAAAIISFFIGIVCFILSVIRIA